MLQVPFLLRLFSKFLIPSIEITEKVTTGWGPGGQSVNKAVNCCVLTHTPTGISVKVHQSRDLQINKHIAYKRLCDKVDFHLNRSTSKLGQQIEKTKKQKDRRKRRREKKQSEVSTETFPVANTPNQL